jgi:DNA-binding MarR family transcriptional regulator
MLSEQHISHKPVNFMSKNMYVQSITLLGTLHRFFLENIQIFLEEFHQSDLNATQALIIYHIGKNIFKVNEIVKNHFYEGSNPSYNLKKMLSAQYLTTSPSAHDRRVLFVALSDKGTLLYQSMDLFFQRQEQTLNGAGFSCERWRRWFEEGRYLVQLHSRCSDLAKEGVPLDEITERISPQASGIGGYSSVVQQGESDDRRDVVHIASM